MEHDVGQEWRQHTAWRNPFTGGREQATVDVARLEDAPEKIDKPTVPHPPPHTSQKQPVMNGTKSLARSPSMIQRPFVPPPS